MPIGTSASTSQVRLASGTARGALASGRRAAFTATSGSASARTTQ